MPVWLELLSILHLTDALHVHTGRRRLLAAVPLIASPLPSPADSAGDAEAYNAGSRAVGRGANALRKNFASTGVVRTGSVLDPLFASGQILDELRSTSALKSQHTKAPLELHTACHGQAPPMAQR